jgi:homocysteine S-methyltransferase
VNVTPEILERMRVASDKGKEFAREEGIAIARESLLDVRDVIAGVQVSAPFGNVRYALQVFDALDEFSSSKEVISVR